MSTTITHTGGTITPTLIDGYRAARALGSIVHEIPNRPNPDVSLRAAGLRRGEFVLVFADQVDAVAAFAALGVAQVLVLVSTDLPPINMSFIVAGGDLVIELDRVTRKSWTVTVPYQEVSP
ncbi:hypothetical protein ACYX8G_14645 [Microbacterium saperdae]